MMHVHGCMHLMIGQIEKERKEGIYCPDRALFYSEYVAGFDEDGVGEEEGFIVTCSSHARGIKFPLSSHYQDPDPRPH